MKVGILTFHSQLNYGGVLQCWALVQALRELGHDPVVIDRWLSKDNWALEKGFDRFSWLMWIRYFVACMRQRKRPAMAIRRARTKSFLKKHVSLTGYHFLEWADVDPDRLKDVEAIVVGSDQVWHYDEYGNPFPYLLEGAPSLLSIGYAVSFGMERIPDEVFDRYRNDLRRFVAIGCRESSGVALCESLGYAAEHVVDPTLLIDAQGWRALIGGGASEQRKELVCYFLSVPIDDLLIGRLSDFARTSGVVVRIFVSDLAEVPVFRSGNVTVEAWAGPVDFVRAFSTAQWVLSDSFHALMFSIIFGRNVRILRPQNANRAKMFARISEIASHATGKVVAEDVGDALSSFSQGKVVSFDREWLGERIAFSKRFLSSSLCTGNA